MIKLDKSFLHISSTFFCAFCGSLSFSSISKYLPCLILFKLSIPRLCNVFCTTLPCGSSTFSFNVTVTENDTENDNEKINDLVIFGDKILGKTVIVCNDSPGFLGNRVGVYAMQVAMTEAFNLGLTVEEADAVFGRPLGIPKTGIFGLYDLIGIDLMADVLKSFIKELPTSDPFHKVGKELPIINQLIADGYTGR